MTYYEAAMQKQANNKKTISFRLDAGKAAELDEL